MGDFSKILKGVKDGFGAIPVVGSAISSVMGIVDGLFGKSDEEKYKDKLNADKAYQKEMIDYTNEANLLASQKSQAYNWQTYDSPAAKMQAYKDAGINPNQVAGQGYQLSGVTSSASAPSAQGYQDSRMAKLNAGIQLGALSSQLRSMKLDNALKHESLLYQKQMRKKLEEQNELSDLEYLQLYNDDNFINDYNATTALAGLPNYDNEPSVQIPAISAIREVDRATRIKVGRARKVAMKRAIDAIENKFNTSSLEYQMQRIGNDKAALKKLQDEGLFELYEVVKGINWRNKISDQDLQSLKQAFNHNKKIIEREDTNNFIFDADWGFDPEYKGFEKFLKSLLGVLSTLFKDSAGSFLSHKAASFAGSKNYD